ncbi:MAG: DNA sulfur modification protein DndD [Acidobacteria bacterium]|nr:DNA sulfur modification protein DndD [Acidobacteriota bacterium]
MRQLTLRDFGTYGGTQSINLAPEAGRPVVLIGGKNGAGKSTFLEAIRLCFYGSLALKSSNTREKYERYLLERIHRVPNATPPPRSAGVEIEFEYGDQDGIRTYTVGRQWDRKASGGVDEQFLVSCNGQPVTDVDASHWQDFVQELIPLGVSDLFFFDGEKVQLLADDESDKRTLSEAVKNLLGTDIIEKLSADLTIYRSRAVQKAASEDEAAAEIEGLSKAIEDLRVRREIVAKEFDTVRNLADSCVSDVQALEQQLQEQGGAYARNRGRLEERRKQIAAKAGALEETIKEQCHGLLPVALAPKLLNSLLKQLTAEQDVRFGVVVDESLANAAKNTMSRLRKLTVRKGGKDVPLSPPEYEAIAAVIRTTHKPSTWDEAPIIHDISSDQEQLIRAWAVTALDTLPKLVKSTSEDLETLYCEQQKVERDLSRAPQEDVLQPLLEKLIEARKRVSETTLEAAQKRSGLEQASEALDRADNNYLKAVDALASTNVQRRSLERAAKVQDVLVEFKNALIVKKIKEVEVEVTTCFNLLSRKLMERIVTINPSTFQVAIKDVRGRLVMKSELSAGEKQIYAISVLWALARVSGRPLPMIIDTPLARLDRDHRSLLGQEYFPNASHQVIILSTDSEIDNAFIPLLGDSIARTYELSFDMRDQTTNVRHGYFAEAPTNAVH